jgi:DNA-binding PadR family transcriptional regulator
VLIAQSSQATGFILSTRALSTLCGSDRAQCDHLIQQITIYRDRFYNRIDDLSFLRRTIMFGSNCLRSDFFASGREGYGRRGRPGRGRRFVDGWGDEQRTPRGDIKYILLTLLAEQPRHGYQLIKELETRQGGFYRPSPGSVYPTLQMLEEGGYLTSQQLEGKRVYTITDSGRQLLAERDRPVDLMDRGDRSSQLSGLKDAIAELSGAVMQVARSSNLDRVSRVREILNRAKREIYNILAEEE